MNRPVCFFSELRDEQQPLAGDKGSTLARLHQKAYPVPNGFNIMPEAFVVDELLPSAWAQAQVCLEQLRQTGAGISFAVRSSALGEDSAIASFAGQFETVLNVRTDEEVRQAVQAVRRSRHGKGVRAYGEAKRIDVPHEMAVVVQQMAPAEISGVLFTADPVTGRRHEMTGNFVFGLGDKLVSGQVEPHTFTLGESTRIWRGGGYEGPPALRRFAGKLYKLGRRLEQELGFPQDIEWAVAGGKLYVLQSRPITTLTGHNPATGEWNDSLTGDYLWTNVNFGEAMNQVMTPFSWTIVQHVFESCSKLLPGFNNSGNIGGRPYLNMSISASVLRALGLNKKAARKILDGMYTRIPDGVDIPTIPLPQWSGVSVLFNSMNLIIKYNRAFREFHHYIAANPLWCERTQGRIQEIERKACLSSLWRDVIEPHLLYGAWIYLGSASRLRYTDKLRRELTGLVGAEDADRLLSSLGNGSGISEGTSLLASLGPMLGLARVAAGEMERAAFMSQYGHRGPNEFELSVPRPAEDPCWFDEQLALLKASPVDVEALLSRQRAEFAAAWERFRSHYQRRASCMRYRIDEAVSRNLQREATRSEYTRDRWLARAFAIRAGQLTGLGEDIFFLTVEEVLGVLSGDETAVQYITARKETYGRYAALPAYPPLIRGHFDPFRWAADPERRLDIYDAHTYGSVTDRSDGQGGAITGVAASAGCVEGMVRRLDHPENGEQLQKGEILVTALTDISWTPLFLRAAAIVTDVGAPLSHAAIVARELGIPAVVGCSNATMRLHTGDRVLVDGGRGVVKILHVALLTQQ